MRKSDSFTTVQFNYLQSCRDISIFENHASLLFENAKWVAVGDAIEQG